MAQKRGRSALKNSTRIKIEGEEFEVSNMHEFSNKKIKRERGSLRKNIKENTNELNHENVIVRNGIESTYDTIAPKRGRAALNNSLKENPDRTNPRRSTRLSKTNTRINIKNEEVKVDNTHEINNEELGCKRGKLCSSKNINADNTVEEIIVVEEGRAALKNSLKENLDRTNPRKSERLAKSNTRIKIENEEVEVDNIHEISNEEWKSKRGRLCSSRNIKAVEEITEIESTFNMRAPKRGKAALKNSLKEKPDLTNRRKSERLSKNNTRITIENEEVEGGNTHEISNEELKRKKATPCLRYPEGFKNKEAPARSFTVVPNLKKRSRRSNSWNYYSHKSSQPLYTIDNNEKQNKTLTKTYDSPPRKTSCRSKNKNYNNTLLKQKQPLYTEDEKKNPEQYANEKSWQTITAASSINEKVLQDVSDSDLLNTKFIIEEKLKSDLGLMMIKRSHNQQLARENKENNFSLWHNEVKNELIKLRKIISMEKLEQYIMWYLNSWQASNNGSKKN